MPDPRPAALVVLAASLVCSSPAPAGETMPSGEDHPAEGKSPDGIEVAGFSAGAVHTPSDTSAWGGERPSSVGLGGDGLPLSQRVASYDLKATLDPAKHTVEGSEHLRWLNRSAEPVKSLYFHLYLNAFEGPTSTWMTEKERYGAFRSGVSTDKGEWGYIDLRSVSQGGKPASIVFVHPDGGPATDRTVARVDLPDAIAPGATAELDLAFHDQLPRVVARTGYFDSYHLVAQWFPKVGVLELPGERGATAPRWNCHAFHLFTEFYADFGSYRAELTAPRDYLVRATGVEQGAPREAGGDLTHTFVQDDVHDFVWTAWNGYAEPLRGSYDGPGSPHVQVEVLAAPEHAESAQIALKSTIDSLAWFSSTLGPYPYPHVTVVVPPYNAAESGGMEYETFFTTFGSTGMGRAATRFVTVHEFGHGYFMGLLASNEFEEPFLDEGMNELWDMRMLSDERVDVPMPGALALLGLHLPPLGYWDYERMQGTQRFQADPIAGNSWDRYSSGSYGLIYSRTATAFRDLEHRLGREAFARGMRLYYERWHHRHPSTADLREALAEGSGQADLVNGWFEEEVYANGPVDDRVVTVESKEVLPEPGIVEEGDKRVEKTQEDVEREIAAGKGKFPWRSIVTVRRYATHVPQKVFVTFEDGHKQTLDFPVAERWHRYTFVDPSKVASVQLDPSGEVLLDLNKLDDGRTREDSGSASARWSLEVSHAAQLLLSLLVAQ